MRKQFSYLTVQNCLVRQKTIVKHLRHQYNGFSTGHENSRMSADDSDSLVFLLQLHSLITCRHELTWKKKKQASLGECPLRREWVTSRRRKRRAFLQKLSDFCIVRGRMVVQIQCIRFIQTENPNCLPWKQCVINFRFLSFTYRES